MPLTNQEIFDKVWERFVVNKAPAALDIDPDTGKASCVYRGKQDPNSDLQCAVGCLIPNEMYSSRLENAAPYEVMYLEPRIADLLGGIDNADFLRQLQICHDTAAKSSSYGDSVDFHTGIKARLVKFAENQKLNLP